MVGGGIKLLRLLRLRVRVSKSIVEGRVAVIPGNGTKGQSGAGQRNRGHEGRGTMAGDCVDGKCHFAYIPRRFDVFFLFFFSVFCLFGLGHTHTAAAWYVSQQRFFIRFFFFFVGVWNGIAMCLL